MTVSQFALLRLFGGEKHAGSRLVTTGLRIFPNVLRRSRDIYNTC